MGERQTYIVGLLIVAVSTGACALAVNYPQLLILRSLGGIGSTMFSIAATGLLIKVSPVWARGRVASVNAAGFLLGNLVGPVLGALVAGWGLRAPFVLYFITLVIAAIVVGFSLRNSVHVQPGSGRDQPPGRTLREALGLSQYRAVLLSGFAHGWASFGVRVSVIPLFVVAVLGESASAAGWTLAAYAAGNALFIFPSGRWNDSVGRKPMILIGLLLAGLSFAVLPLAPALWTAALIVAVAGVGTALSNPGQQAVLADVVGRRGRSGQVVASYQMVTDLGAVLGPVLAGLLVDGLGFGWGFGVTSAILFLAAAVWVFTPDSRQLAEAEARD